MQRAIKFILCLLGLVLCVGLLLKGSIALVPSGTWAPSGTMSEARSGASAVLLQDSRVLVTGGEGASGTLVSAELFDSGGSFFGAAPMYVPRSKHASIVLQDGRVLVVGGSTNGGGATNAAEIYDPMNDSWTNLSGMTEARFGHTASLLKDGRVLIAGGESSSTVSNTIELFNPDTNTFSFAGVLSSQRKAHAAAVLSDGRVLMAGGSDGSNVLASVDIYDPTDGTISMGPFLSTPRIGLSATTLLDGKVFVAGGNNGSTELATAELYDPASGASPLPGGLAVARSDHLAVLLPNNNSVLIVGGTSSGVALSSAELFQPWTQSFLSTGSLSSARTAAAGGPLSLDGLLLLAGGTSGSGPLASAELYGFATVKTDKDDYAPGQTVTITGKGWQPGETVTLSLLESPNLDNHGPFTAVADSGGNIYNNQFVPDEHDATILFYLTATGSVSQAQTTFTDNKPNSVSVAAQSPNPVSPGGTATYNPVTVTFGGNSQIGGCNANLSATGLPAGATPTFTPSSVSGNTGDSPSSILTISTTAGLLPNTYNFTVTATGNGCNQSGSASTSATLVVVKPSTTTLTSSANPSAFGQSTTLTATVTGSGGTPTGTVTFKDGVTTLGTGTLNGSGVATLSASTLAAGSHQITAVYGGSSAFASSTSNTITQTVNQANTTTTVNSSANPSVLGQSVTFTATVNAVSPGSGTPTGTVTFKDGTATLGTGTLNGSGVAAISTTTLSVAAHSITAVYGGVSNFTGSDNAASPLSQVVNQANTTTVVTSSANPSAASQSVTFTATVTASSPGSGTPTGTVTFKDGTTTLGTGTLNGSGVATFATSSLNVGSRSITAVYGGDTSFITSTSVALNQTVNPKLVITPAVFTSVAGNCSPVLTAQTVGADGTTPVSVATLTTVTLTSNSGGGAFFAGANCSGSAVSTITIGAGNSSASFSYKDNTPGTSTITVSIGSGSGQSQASATASINPNLKMATGTFNIGVGACSPTINVQTADGTGHPFDPTGPVTVNLATTSPSGGKFFSDSGCTNPITSVPISGHNAMFFYSDTQAGTPTLTFTAGTGSGQATVAQAVTISKASPTFSNLTASQTVAYGTASITLSGKIAAGSLFPPTTESVSITINGVSVQAAIGTGGSFSTTFDTHLIPASATAYTIAYSYTADANLNGATNTSTTLTVNKASTSTALTSDLNPSFSGQSVKFTATVTNSSAASTGTITGTVTFKDGANSLGTGTLDGSGQATLITAALSAGPHSITAVYNGDGNFSTSTSSALAQTVNNADTTTSVSSSLNPSIFGLSVSFSATVATVQAGLGTPTGSVQFLIDNVAFGSAVPLLNGSATGGSTASLTGGTHTVTAVYTPTGNFKSSQGGLTQTVNKANSSLSVSSAPNPSNYGVAVTFSATVNPSTATGAVQFFDGGNPFGSAVPVSGGTAMLVTAGLVPGNHVITASYSGDNNFNNTSTASAITQVVNQIVTTTSLSSSNTSALTTDSITLTATVIPTSATGNVQLYDGNNALGSPTALSGGVAAVTFSPGGLSIGTHTVTAVYGGDAADFGSTSAPLTQTINNTPTGANVAVQPYDFTANNTIAADTVTFDNVTQIGITSIETKPTSDQSFPPLPSNYHQGVPGNFFDLTTTATFTGPVQVCHSYLNVTYTHPNTLTLLRYDTVNHEWVPTTDQTIGTSDPNNPTVCGTATALGRFIIVEDSSTKTELSSSPNPSTYGSTGVTFTATITPSTATGSVEFFDGPISLGTSSVSNGTATFVASKTQFTGGDHTIKAVYTDPSDYFGSSSATLTQTVNKADQTITFAALTDKTYGAAPFAVTAASDSGLSVTLSASGNCTAAGNTVTITGAGSCSVTASQDGDTNYKPAAAVIHSFNIAKALLCVTADDKTKPYGDDLPAFTAGYSGFVYTDTVASLGGTLTFTSTVTKNSSTGSYTITPGGLTSNNYSITFKDGKLTVTPVPLKITADDRAKVYGDNLPSFTASYNGFVLSDGPSSLAGTLAFTTTATASSSVAGSPYTITPSGVTSANYTISFADGKLNVTPAPLTVTVNDSTKVYGAPLPNFAVTYNGFVLGEHENVLGGSLVFSGAAVNSPVNGSPYTVTASGLTSTNYNISHVPGKLSVTPAPLTVKADYKTKVYGAPLPAFTASYSGFVLAEDSQVLSGVLTFNTTATQSSSVAGSPYTITPGGLTSTNYAITFKEGNLNVTPAPLTVTADPTTKVYGAALPTFTAAYNGLVLNETPSSLGGTLSFSTVASQTSPVGTYQVTPSGVAWTNYTITFAPGILTVTPAPLTGTPVNATRLYGAPDPTFTATYSGFVNNENSSIIVGTLSCTTTATVTSNIGTYSFTSCTGLSAPNYTITYVFTSATFTITPAPLKVNVANASRVYGDPNPQFTGSLVGLLNGDAITVSYSTAATSTSAVGNYDISATLNDSNPPKLLNYALTLNKGTLTVTKATPVITWNDPAPIFFGTPLSTTQLNASATFKGNPLLGTFNYTPAVGTVLNAGNNQGLMSTFTPADTTNFNGVGQITVQIIVNPAPTTTTISSSLSQPPATPVGITLTATVINNVTPVMPVGTVIFTDTSVLPVKTLGPPQMTTTAGKATLTLPDSALLGMGTHVITATFTPSSTNFLSSVSGPNAAPGVIITGPPSGYVQAVSTAVPFSATFTDPDTVNPSALWSFDTTASVSGAVNVTGSAISASTTFSAAGVYNVTLTFTDGLGGIAIANAVSSSNAPPNLPATVVVYDPNGGFVTGGGWINSPKGAYYPGNPQYFDIAGKASFGFVSKYQKGANVPTGETEFNYQVANFNFHSTSYQWLVVSGSMAQYKGSGTINGSGNYNFLLTALDGNPDGFRIKITDSSGTNVIYDNKISTDDTINTQNTQAIGGGSIVVHK
jgi:Bacterial Ig-like domain (group 3)/MBG domain (YGX type)/Kelch motif